MPKYKKKFKKPIEQETWPNFEGADDFEFVPKNFHIYRYQEEALKRQRRKTGMSDAEMNRHALDQYLFQKRRASDKEELKAHIKRANKK